MRSLAYPTALGLLTLSLLCAALALDSHLAHGVHARFVEQGSEQAITETIEHRTYFPNTRRVVARVVEGWDRSARPLPPGPLAFTVEIDAWLEVPEGGPRTLEARSESRVSSTIDGVETSVLAPGRRRLKLRWQTRTDVGHGLELVWKPESGDFERIPNEAFSAPGGAPTGPRALSLAIILGVLVASGYALHRRLGPALDPRPLHVVSFALIALLGFSLRVYDYDVVPEWNSTADEMYSGWDGVELLTSGRTRGWSLFEGHYPAHVSRERFAQLGSSYVVLSPAFEHPPLLHLLCGVAERALGTERWQEVQVAHVRVVPLLLYLPTALLLFLLARRLVEEPYAAHLASLVYAVTPTIALSGRLAKEEALLTPLVLASLLLFCRLRAQGGSRVAFASGLVMGLGLLVKLPALAFCVALFVLVFRARGPRAALLSGLGMSVGALLLLLFAALVDWKVFVDATSVQASIRPTHFNLFQRYFVNAFVNRMGIGRGHLLFLWIAYFVALRDREGRIDLVGVVPPLTYLGMLAVSAGDYNFGWYFLPVYPFLCIYAGRFLRDVMSNPSVAFGLPVIGLLLMYSCNFIMDFALGRTAEGWAMNRPLVALAFYGSFAPLLLATAIPSRFTRLLARGAMVTAFCCFVLFSTYTLVFYERIRDTHGAFDDDDFYDS